MVEVLVSILVLAIGILAVAGMQLTALRTTQQSSTQTAALELAADIADKMRANDQVMHQAAASNPFLSVNFDASAGVTNPNKFCIETTSDCSPQELAAYDLYEWEKRLVDIMPGGRALICRDSSPWNQLTISFTWCCTTTLIGAGGPVVIKLGWPAKSQDGLQAPASGSSSASSSASGSASSSASGSASSCANSSPFPPQVALTVAP